jgi:hypothetical protein
MAQVSLKTLQPNTAKMHQLVEENVVNRKLRFTVNQALTIMAVMREDN